MVYLLHSLINSLRLLGEINLAFQAWVEYHHDVGPLEEKEFILAEKYVS